MYDDPEIVEAIHITVSDDLNKWDDALDYAYPSGLPSGVIAEDLATASGITGDLRPVLIEETTETIERTKGLGGGIHLEAKAGQYSITVTREPVSVVKKTTRTVWRNPEEEGDA